MGCEKSYNNSNKKMEIELKKVKKELNELKLKTVEKQQEEFGEKSKEDWLEYNINYVILCLHKLRKDVF